MFRRITRHLETQNFLKSSSLFYVSNIFIAGLNYLIIIFVSFQLSQQLATWTALAALIGVFFSVVQGVTFPISKKISALDSSKSDELESYYSFARRYAFRLSFLVGILPLGILLLDRNQNFLIVLFMILAVTAYFYVSTENQFVLGTIRTKQALLVNLTAGVGRFLSTLVFIWIGLNIYALPLGYALGFGLTWILLRIYNSAYTFEVTQKQVEFSFWSQLFHSAQVITALFFVSLALNVDVILAEIFFPDRSADLFAVVSNFGQIIFFGSTAFMNMFIAYAARSKNLVSYWQSLGVAISLSLIVGLMIWLFDDLAMSIFNRPEYAGQGGLIALYSIFISCYNVIYISIYFLIAKGYYKPIFLLGVFVCLNAVLLWWSAQGGLDYFGSSQIWQFIWINIMTIGAGAIFLIVTISSKFGLRFKKLESS